MQSIHSQSCSSMSFSMDEEDIPYPRLNDQYNLIKVIGQGSSAKVWLAQSIDNPDQQFAIKIMSTKYIESKESRKAIRKEVEILCQLDHENIVSLYDFGDKGVINFDGDIYKNKVYIVMEYIEGPLLFDLTQKEGPIGEQMGLFFARQLIS